MQLTNLTYNGKKVYRDEYGNVWAPGDTKLVTEEQAGRLIRFPVFERPAATTKAGKQAAEKPVAAQKTEDDDEAAKAERERLEQVEKATKLEHERQRLKKQEDEAKENMLLTIESMDKGALADYAMKYDTKLNKRQSVSDLRLEVANLVEQFGPR